MAFQRVTRGVVLLYPDLLGKRGEQRQDLVALRLADTLECPYSRLKAFCPCPVRQHKLMAFEHQVHVLNRRRRERPDRVTIHQVLRGDEDFILTKM